MKLLPYDPILHDLSLTARDMTSGEMVDYWLGNYSFSNKVENKKFWISDMLDNVDVVDWYDTIQQVNIPRLEFTFSGIFTHIMLLDFGYNATVAVAQPLMGTWYISNIAP